MRSATFIAKVMWVSQDSTAQSSAICCIIQNRAVLGLAAMSARQRTPSYLHSPATLLRHSSSSRLDSSCRRCSLRCHWRVGSHLGCSRLGLSSLDSVMGYSSFDSVMVRVHSMLLLLLHRLWCCCCCLVGLQAAAIVVVAGNVVHVVAMGLQDRCSSRTSSKV
jgi:hypothetical protein